MSTFPVDEAVAEAVASGKFRNDGQVIKALEEKGYIPEIVRSILRSLWRQNRVTLVAGRLQARSSFEAIAFPPD